MTFSEKLCHCQNVHLCAESQLFWCFFDVHDKKVLFDKKKCTSLQILFDFELKA